jgi:hypothetical protein
MVIEAAVSIKTLISKSLRRKCAGKDYRPSMEDGEVSLTLFALLKELEAQQIPCNSVRPWNIRVSGSSKIGLSAESEEVSADLDDKQPCRSLSASKERVEEQWYWCPEKLMGYSQSGEVSIYVLTCVCHSML